LVLLLILSALNYWEMRRTKQETDAIWSQLEDQATASQVDEIEGQIKESKQHLEEIEFSLRCMSSHFDPACVLAGRFHPEARRP